MFFLSNNIFLNQIFSNLKSHEIRLMKQINKSQVEIAAKEGVKRQVIGMRLRRILNKCRKMEVAA